MQVLNKERSIKIDYSGFYKNPEYLQKKVQAEIKASTDKSAIGVNLDVEAARKLLESNFDATEIQTVKDYVKNNINAIRSMIGMDSDGVLVNPKGSDLWEQINGKSLRNFIPVKMKSLLFNKKAKTYITKAREVAVILKIFGDESKVLDEQQIKSHTKNKILKNWDAFSHLTGCERIKDPVSNKYVHFLVNFSQSKLAETYNGFSLRELTDPNFLKKIYKENDLKVTNVAPTTAGTIEAILKSADCQLASNWDIKRYYREQIEKNWAKFEDIDIIKTQGAQQPETFINNPDYLRWESSRNIEAAKGIEDIPPMNLSNLDFRKGLYNNNEEIGPRYHFLSNIAHKFKTNRFMSSFADPQTRNKALGTGEISSSKGLFKVFKALGATADIDKFARDLQMKEIGKASKELIENAFESGAESLSGVRRLWDSDASKYIYYAGSRDEMKEPSRELTKTLLNFPSMSFISYACQKHGVELKSNAIDNFKTLEATWKEMGLEIRESIELHNLAQKIKEWRINFEDNFDNDISKITGMTREPIKNTDQFIYFSGPSKNRSTHIPSIGYALASFPCPQFVNFVLKEKGFIEKDSRRESCKNFLELKAVFNALGLIFEKKEPEQLPLYYQHFSTKAIENLKQSNFEQNKEAEIKVIDYLKSLGKRTSFNYAIPKVPYDLSYKQGKSKHYAKITTTKSNFTDWIKENRFTWLKNSFETMRQLNSEQDSVSELIVMSEDESNNPKIKILNWDEVEKYLDVKSYSMSLHDSPNKSYISLGEYANQFKQIRELLTDLGSENHKSIDWTHVFENFYTRGKNNNALDWSSSKLSRNGINPKDIIEEKNWLVEMWKAKLEEERNLAPNSQIASAINDISYTNETQKQKKSEQVAKLLLELFNQGFKYETWNTWFTKDNRKTWQGHFDKSILRRNVEYSFRLNRMAAWLVYNKLLKEIDINNLKFNVKYKGVNSPFTFSYYDRDNKLVLLDLKASFKSADGSKKIVVDREKVEKAKSLGTEYRVIHFDVDLENIQAILSEYDVSKGYEQHIRAEPIVFDYGISKAEN